MVWRNMNLGQAASGDHPTEEYVGRNPIDKVVETTTRCGVVRGSDAIDKYLGTAGVDGLVAIGRGYYGLRDTLAVSGTIAIGAER